MTYGYSMRIVQLNEAADAERLGVRLGRACIARSIPVQDVAQALGVTRQAIYKWFAGDTEPTKRLTEQVKQYLAALT